LYSCPSCSAFFFFRIRYFLATKSLCPPGYGALKRKCSPPPPFPNCRAPRLFSSEEATLQSTALQSMQTLFCFTASQRRLVSSVPQKQHRTLNWARLFLFPCLSDRPFLSTLPDYEGRSTPPNHPRCPLLNRRTHHQVCLLSAFLLESGKRVNLGSSRIHLLVPGSRFLHWLRFAFMRE